MSEQLANLEVRECKASNFSDVDLVFSGLDSDVAGEVGEFTVSMRCWPTPLTRLQKWSS